MFHRLWALLYHFPDLQTQLFERLIVGYLLGKETDVKAIGARHQGLGFERSSKTKDIHPIVGSISALLIVTHVGEEIVQLISLMLHQEQGGRNGRISEKDPLPVSSSRIFEYAGCIGPPPIYVVAPVLLIRRKMACYRPFEEKPVSP